MSTSSWMEQETERPPEPETPKPSVEREEDRGDPCPDPPAPGEELPGHADEPGRD